MRMRTSQTQWILSVVWILFGWVLRAWNHDILPTIINNCFRKSTLVPEPVQLPIQSPDLTALFAQVQYAGGLEDAMTISKFPNPTESQRQKSSS